MKGSLAALHRIKFTQDPRPAILLLGTQETLPWVVEIMDLNYCEARGSGRKNEGCWPRSNRRGAPPARRKALKVVRSKKVETKYLGAPTAQGEGGDQRADITWLSVRSAASAVDQTSPG